MDCIAAKYVPELPFFEANGPLLAGLESGLEPAGHPPMGITAELWNPKALFAVWNHHRAKYIARANGDHEFWPSNTDESRIHDDVLRSKKGKAPWGAFKVYCWRCNLQMEHSIPQFGLDLFLQFCAGLLLGFIYKDAKLTTLDAVALMYPLGLGLTTALSSLKTFGGERIVFWREAALGSGM